MVGKRVWNGRSRRLVASAAVLLLMGLLGAPPAGAVPTTAPAAVPPATGNNAVITVQVGADRVGTTGVSPLAGVTLQLYNGTTAPTTPVTDAWATCVSDADGDCSFVVPDTQTGVLGCFGATAGDNCDRRFWIVQEGVPSGFTENPVLRTGNGDGSGSQRTPYQFRTGSTLRANRLRSVLTMLGVVIGVAAVERTIVVGAFRRGQFTWSVRDALLTLTSDGGDQRQYTRN